MKKMYSWKGKKKNSIILISFTNEKDKSLGGICKCDLLVLAQAIFA